MYQILILVWWIDRIKINYRRMQVAQPVLEHRPGLRSHCLGVRPHVQNDRAGQRCHHRNRDARPRGAHELALSQLVARNRPQA